MNPFKYTNSTGTMKTCCCANPMMRVKWSSCVRIVLMLSHSLGMSSFATSGRHWLIAHSRSRVMTFNSVGCQLVPTCTTST